MWCGPDWCTDMNAEPSGVISSRWTLLVLLVHEGLLCYRLHASENLDSTKLLHSDW